MALFIDGGLCGLEELKAHEGSVLETASSEGIDLTAKLDLAQQELGIELRAFLCRNGRSAGDICRVVATPELRRWLALAALRLAYRDAYHNRLNDRYRGKLEEYQRLAKEARRQMFESGVGMVSDALSQAGPAVVTAVAGTSSAAEYSVRVTWINAGGQEGAPSAVVACNLPSGAVPVVSVSGAPRTRWAGMCT